FIIGCFCGIKISAFDLFLGLSSFCGIFMVKVVIFKIKSFGNLYVMGILVSFIIGAFLGGYHHCNTFAQVSDIFGNNVAITGRVTDLSDNKFVLCTEKYSVQVTINKDMRVKENEALKVEGILYPIDGAKFNGDTDFRYYYALRGIVGRIYEPKITRLGYADKFSVWDIGSNVRNYVEKMVARYSSSQKVEGLMFALLTGNTQKLDDGVRESFRLTGISHLVAVSGLHMGIFLSFFVIFSSRIRKKPLIHFLFILFLVIFYILIIGERASVLRAGIMAVIGYFVSGINRRNGGIMKLMLAGVIICIINPYYAVDVGFQLSFVVTLGIMLYAEFFKNKVIAIPVIAMVFIMPFSTYYFNTISLETVVVNILTVPLIPGVILFGYIGCVIPVFGNAAVALSSLVVWVAEYFAKYDFLHLTVPSPGIWDFIVFYLLCCGVYFLLDRHQVGKMALMIIVSLLIIANVCVYETVNKNNVSIKSVGDMVHITTYGGYNVIINPGYKMQDYVIKAGIDEIGLVIMTDSNKDKLQYIINTSEYCKVREVFVPENGENENLQLENYSVLYYNQDGCNFNVDGVGFEFAHNYLMIDFYNKIINIPLPVRDNQDINTYRDNVFRIMSVY
ncbi:MAG: ComEC/Rec2 family competence protein, partial [Clostridia bacterium]|nr:ComEC/Rec2 family competence protein [Clostridia bacterium]